MACIRIYTRARMYNARECVIIFSENEFSRKARVRLIGDVFDVRSRAVNTRPADCLKID